MGAHDDDGAGRRERLPLWLAIASLTLAVLGILWVLPVVGSIGGVVLGHVARRRALARTADGAGLAKAGMVVGYAGCVLAVLIAVVVPVLLGLASQAAT